MRLALSGVTKRFGPIVALDELSIEVPPGELVAVLGVNGAGKSTLLRLLGSILVPTRGEIRIDGELFTRERIDLRKRLAFLPEFAPVFNENTPVQHIAMVKRLYDGEPSAAATDEVATRIVDLLRDFDLIEVANRRLAELSRGQAYKTALCALLAVDPELWIFDEPFATGMDARAVAAFRRHAEAAVKRGRTIFYSTQLIELVDSLATRVAIIDRGRLVLWESLSELRSRGSVHDALSQWVEAPAEKPQ